MLLVVLALSGKALTASFTSSVISGCAPLTVSFTNTSTGATSYQWNFGNGNTSTQASTSATFPSPGNYTVTLTAYNGSSNSTYSVTITVYALPNVNFTASPTTACANTPITFTDQSTLNAPGTPQYSWNFGNGASGSGSTITYTYTNPGTYNVNLTVMSGAGCVSSLTQTGLITITPNPVANFTAGSTTVCSNNPVVTFTNSSSGTGNSYTWDFGDGTTSNQASPTHTYSGNPNSYTVKLIVTNSSGCSDTLIQANYIHVIPGTTASFTGTTSICVGAAATFTNTSTPGTTGSNWNFGDGTTGSGTTTSHIYTSPGNFTVTLTNINNACTGTTTQTITVYPPPSTVFNASPLHPCPAPATIQFSAPAGATSYSWIFGDGGTSTVQSPQHTYNNNGYYTVKLTATSAHGCVDSDSVANYIIIYPLDLNITTDVSGGCIPFPVNFSSLVYYPDQQTNTPVNYPYAVSTYSWNFGDGSSSNAANPAHTYTTAGVYTVTLTVTTSNGCTISKTTIIHAGTRVTPSFTASPTNACVKVPITFTNNTVASNTVTYEWYFGDGSSSTSNSTTHYYSSPFTYDVTLVADNQGCLDSLVKSAYITINPPNAKFTYQYSCNARNVSFTNSSIGATSFEWNFGDGSTDNVTVSPTHLYAANGSYTVMLATHNSTSGCSDTSISIIIISSPQAVISVPDTALCKDDTVTLTGTLNSAPPNGARTYNWYLDNTGFADTTSVFKYAFHSIGQKPVTLVISDYRGCNDSASITLLIAHPTVSFTGAPLPVCSPIPVLFTDQSTDAPTTHFTSQTWRYGDGNVLGGNSTTVTHSYSAAGSYTVKLYVTDNVGCTDSLVKTSYAVVHKPHADFSALTTVCRDRAVTFANLSTGSNPGYLWSFGDGDTSTMNNPVHFYLQTGTYTVKLVETDDLGCQDSIIKTSYIHVVDDPVAAFTASDTVSICSPLIDTFTNQSTGGISYAWSFGDGNSSALTNPTNVYTSPTQYNVRLVVTNTYGCTDTAIVPVKLLGYAGVLTYAPVSGCVPLTVTFTANVTNVPSYTYDFSDGNTLTTTSTSVTHTYTVPGPHLPRLVLSNSRCQAYSWGVDTIKADAVIAGFKTVPNPICGADSVHFVDTSRAYFSTIDSETWFLTKNIVSMLASPVQYYTPGKYTITLISKSTTGCVDTSVQTVNVYNIPVISAGSDTTICVGDSATLLPTGGVSYVWSPAAKLSCSYCTNPSTSPAVPTWYYVTGTDAHGCTNTDSVLVRLKTKATGTAGASGDMCLKGSFQLNAYDSFANAQYTWIPPANLNNSHISDPIATPDASTQYMVIIREGKCIPDTGYVDVNVHPLPKISVSPGQTIMAGSSLQLETSETNVTKYVWIPPTGLSCDSCADPVATPKNSTLYQVYGYTDYGCVDSAQVKIDVICDHSQVFLPNTFTPNNDGANDRFYPRGKGLQIIKSFRIYDRWGELLFEKREMELNDFSNGWDGTFKGTRLTPDVYVYVVNAICDTGAPISWTGDITLLR